MKHFAKPFSYMSGGALLHLVGEKSSLVMFRVMLNPHDMTGGGLLRGKSAVLRCAARSGSAFLQITEEQLVGILIGYEFQGEVPIVLLGAIKRLSSGGNQ